jgi:hypothetical protein
MPYRFGLDKPRRFRNRFYHIANKRYKASPARRNVPQIRKKGEVRLQWGLDDITPPPTPPAWRSYVPPKIWIGASTSAPNRYLPTRPNRFGAYGMMTMSFEPRCFGSWLNGKVKRRIFRYIMRRCRCNGLHGFIIETKAINCLPDRYRGQLVAFFILRKAYEE